MEIFNFRKIIRSVFVTSLLIIGIHLQSNNLFGQSGVWTKLTDIPTARCNGSAVELDGKIYVIGGSASRSSSNNIMEVYDPVQDSWDTTLAPMPTARIDFGIAVVDGKIFVMGGTSGHTISDGHMATVEMYDPVFDTWVTKNPMPAPRREITCGVIENKIYVAGGSPTGYWASTTTKLDVYDPATDTWDTNRSDMKVWLFGPAGAVINGKFYLVGGMNGNFYGQSVVQFYDPLTDLWELGPALNYARAGHTVDAVNGKLYAIGGLSNEGTSNMIDQIEAFDPSNDLEWNVIGNIPERTQSHASAVFDNKIYILGGSNEGQWSSNPNNDVYSFDPEPSEPQPWEWTQLTTDIPTPRTGAQACEVGGKIYVIGGTATDDGSMNVMEVYDPITKTWNESVSQMPTPRFAFGAAVVNEKIYVFGGTSGHTNPGGLIGSVEVYDPATDTWATKNPMPTPRRDMACGVINDKIYIAAGSPTAYYGSSTTKLEVYDPATDTWDLTKEDMPKLLFGAKGAVLNGKFYLVGGIVSTNWYGQKWVQIYDAAEDSWQLGPDLNIYRFNHSLNVVNNRLYAIGGTRQATIAPLLSTVSQVEVFDPNVDDSWTNLCETPRVMRGHASCVFNNTIYIFSGIATSNNVSTPTAEVYSFNPNYSDLPVAKNWIWHKYSDNPVLEPGDIGEWDMVGVEMPSVVKVDGKYNMWYSNSINTEIGYAISDDGKNWTKHADNPVLKPGGTGSWPNEYQITLPYVIYDKEIFHMWYYGYKPDPLIGELGYATSSDGINWTKHITNPALNCGETGCWDEKAVLGASVLKENDQFNMWYVGSNFVEDLAGIGFANSTDGINWEKNIDPVMRKHEDEINLWSACVLNIGEQYLMWYTEGYWGGTRLDVRFALSNDGIEWSREEDNIAIAKGEFGEWDSKHIGFPSVLYDEDDKKYKMWYYGSNYDLDSRIGYAESDGIVSVLDEKVIPNTYELSQNYPNPFNPLTTIKYSIPVSVNSEKSKVKNVKLVVFDILGREVETLVNENQMPGKYENQFDGSQLTSGIYIYRLKAGDFLEAKKMILLK